MFLYFLYVHNCLQFSNLPIFMFGTVKTLLNKTKFDTLKRKTAFVFTCILYSISRLETDETKFKRIGISEKCYLRGCGVDHWRATYLIWGAA
jgi:hypothetical protein